jgi:hypothetical protein
MKKIYVLLLLFFLLKSLSAQNFKLEDAETILAEKFEYDVSWTFLHIGTITLTTEYIISNPGFLKITMDIKSAPLLPFINIDEHNVAIMRAADGMTFYYYGKSKKDGKISEIIIRFIESENFTVYEAKDCDYGTIIHKDTLRHKEPYLVGTSLINYTRQFADSGLIKTVPTMLGGKFYPTILNFCGPTDYVNIDNYKKPIRCFQYKGSADWEGNATAGLSGQFTGWLSDDNDKVVVYAEMEILLGSIDIELSEWYKPDWTPPTSKKLFTQTKKIK